MALIDCPSCRKKISDKAKSCSHCSIDLENLDEEKLATLRKINLINESQRLMSFSFVAILMFCAGILVLNWYNAQPGSWEYLAALTSSILGFVIYIIIRVKILILKRGKKA